MAQGDLENLIVDGVAHGEEVLGVVLRVGGRDEQGVEGVDWIDAALLKGDLVVRKFFEQLADVVLVGRAAQSIVANQDDQPSVAGSKGGQTRELTADVTRLRLPEHLWPSSRAQRGAEQCGLLSEGFSTHVRVGLVRLELIFQRGGARGGQGGEGRLQRAL